MGWRHAATRVSMIRLLRAYSSLQLYFRAGARLRARASAAAGAMAGARCGGDRAVAAGGEPGLEVERVEPRASGESTCLVRARATQYLTLHYVVPWIALSTLM